MKKKAKPERVWKLVFIFIFFFLYLSFQFAYNLITRAPSSVSPLSQEHKKRRATKLIRNSPSSISLLSANKEAVDSKVPINELSIHPKPIKSTSIICDRSHKLYDLCHLKTPAILEPTTPTFFAASSTPSSEPPLVEKIRPYPRKRDKDTMSKIREITLTTEISPLSCTIEHSNPGLVFSIGGFTGNFFHDFNDGFVPLFITINTLLPEQDVTLIITDYSEWWYAKYEAMLPQFSKLKLVNLDNQTDTHCFPSVVAGLISHGPMTINPALIPRHRSFLDFRAHLEEAYRKCLVWPPPKIKGKPRLVLVSRAGAVGRVILNQDNVIKAAQREGFDVVVFEPSAYTYLCDVYRLINGSHALMGVHGAALTHTLFLQPGAAFIQVVPLGGDWLAQTYFRSLAKGMKLEYMEYKIEAKESTLAKKYGNDHVMVRDPNSITSRNWSALHSIYLRSQDVTLDIARFRGYLKHAYAKAKKLMESQGLHVRRRLKIKKFIRPPVFSYTHGVR